MKWLNGYRMRLVLVGVVFCSIFGLPKLLGAEVRHVPEEYHTIQAALAACRQGDIIQLAPGTYNENIHITMDIVLQSADPNDPDITLETIIIGDAARPVVSLDRVGSSCRLQGLTLTGGITGIVCIEGMPQITGCRILANQGHGIEISEGAGPTVSHCIVVGNRGFGVAIFAGAGPSSNLALQPTILNCTIARNTAGGVIGETFKITNSIVFFNGNDPNTSQIKSSNAYVSYSCIQNSAGGLGIFDKDPSFVSLDSWAYIDSLNEKDTDWIKGDYHLLSEYGRWDPKSQQWVFDDWTSPCINRGRRSDSIGGEPLPHGDRINMGAYGGTTQASKRDMYPLLLNLPDRDQAPESPPEGWCGEAAIQMVSLYYGAFLPQTVIHALPNPIHPDLYSNDLPVALEKIGLEFSRFQNTGTTTVDDYIEWIMTQLDWGNPTISGCKILPTSHPEWSLDHFIVAVGYTHQGLIYNTTWGYQEERSYETLSSMEVQGISFANRSNRYYGLAIKDFRSPYRGLALNIYPSQQNHMHYFDIQIRGLEEGGRYVLLRFDEINKAQQLDMIENAAQQQVLWAQDTIYTINGYIPPDDISIFKCLPVAEGWYTTIPELGPFFIGLIAQWALDEIEGAMAYDSVGENHAELFGDPIWQPTDGMIDGALILDGIDDFVGTEYVRDPSEGPLSVFAWVKGGAPGQAVLSQAGGSNWLCADSLEGNLMTELKGLGRSTKPLQSQTNITDGNWHRIGLVWDGSNRMLYVDDVAVAEDTQTNLAASENGLYIGAGKNLDAASFFSGLIDDVRIYNRAVTP